MQKKWAAETWVYQGRESTCYIIRNIGIKSKEVNFPKDHPYTWITVLLLNHGGNGLVMKWQSCFVWQKLLQDYTQNIQYHTESGICFSSCHTSSVREHSELQNRPKGTILCTIITRKRGCQVGIWVKFTNQLALEQCYYF